MIITVKSRKTLFIQELKPAFNVDVSSEKLMLYQLAVAFNRFIVKIGFLNLGSRPPFHYYVYSCKNFNGHF